MRQELASWELELSWDGQGGNLYELKPAAQVLIRWALQHGTSVSPKAGSREHVQVCSTPQLSIVRRMPDLNTIQSLQHCKALCTFTAPSWVQKWSRHLLLNTHHIVFVQAQCYCQPSKCSQLPTRGTCRA